MPLLARLKSMSGRERLSYLWEYYKWPALVILAVAVGLGFYIRDLRRGDTSLVNVTLVNASALAEESEAFASFPAEYGYDGGRTVSVNASLRINLETPDALSVQAFQVVVAEFLTGEIDLFASGEDVFRQMSDNGAFLPLPELLTEEELDAWAGRLWYAEDPETGAREAVGLVMTDTVLQSEECFGADKTVVAGFGANAKHPDAAARLMEYLLIYGK